MKRLLPNSWKNSKPAAESMPIAIVPREGFTANPSMNTRANALKAKAFQVMIDNNLDFEIALYPYELVTYGETGQPCQNWLQYRLIKNILKSLPKTRLSLLSPVILSACFLQSPPRPRYHHKRTDGRHVRQPGLGNCGRTRRCQLRTDDGGRLDVYRTAGHRSRNVQHNSRRRQKISRRCGTRRSCGQAVCILRSRRHERCTAQGGEHRKRSRCFAEVDLSRIKTRYDQGWVNTISDNLDEVFAEAKQYLAEKKIDFDRISRKYCRFA